MTKRVFDQLFALTMLLVTAPLLLVAMLLIWFGDGAAPLYFGERIGQGGKPFRIVKLRTMRVGAELGIPTPYNQAITFMVEAMQHHRIRQRLQPDIDYEAMEKEAKARATA